MIFGILPGRRTYITPAAYVAYVTEATNFITANPEILAVMVAGAVIGLIAYAVKRLAKAGR